MKISSSSSGPNLDNTWPRGAYPPPGFAPFAGCELGNGDQFGMYWSTGREDQEPIICELQHDDWSLVPTHSSYAVWEQWAKANDWEWGEEEVDDPKFVMFKLHRARQALQANDPESAIPLFEEACTIMPDIAEPWNQLASQYKRLGDQVNAEAAALSAAKFGSWAFDSSSFTRLRMINADGQHADDPLVIRRGILNKKIGGVKENPLYGALRECIAEYKDRGEWVPAITLLYNYGLAMSRETPPFQERNGYSTSSWLEEYDGLCFEGLGQTRWINA